MVQEVCHAILGNVKALLRTQVAEQQNHQKLFASRDSARPSPEACTTHVAGRFIAEHVRARLGKRFLHFAHRIKQLEASGVPHHTLQSL